MTVHRRICSGPAGVASCCSLSYDGLENGIFNFSGANLISHKVLLANHFANALGVTHQAGFEGLRMASASIDGPNGSFKLDDRTFASAIQAFNRLAAREIRHVCSGPECSNLYTSEVLASRREAEAAGEVWRPDPREGNFDALRTHAFTRDKVIVGDGTIFANASAMRDRSEKDIKGITQPSSEAPQIAGGFTPMGPGSQKPSGAPWPREERGCAYVFRNHFIDGMRDSVRSLAFRWANFRRIPGKRSQTGNEPLSTEEFAAMRGGLPESLRALVDLAAFPHPQCSPNCVACARAPKRPWMTAHRGVLATGWCPGHFHDLGALMHSLLTKDYSWIYCRILGLQLMRRLLLGGRALNSLELAYLRDDAPMIAAVLEFHSPELPTVQATDHGGHLKQYAFSPAVLPLMRDIYCTNLLAFEPSSNLRRATTPSPLRCLVDATDFLWGLEGVEAGGDEEWAAKEVRLCERAKLLLEELEVRDPIYYTNGTLRPASDEYKEQVERPSVYPFHPLLYERPHFIDWENTKGRSTKERLERHCALPERPHTKGHVSGYAYVGENLCQTSFIFSDSTRNAALSMSTLYFGGHGSLFASLRLALRTAVVN